MGKRAVFKLMHLMLILITFLFFGLAILGALVPKADPNIYPEMPFIGLALPLIALLNLLFALYWTIKWRYWVWISLGAIAINYNYLNAKYRLSSPDIAGPAKSITVATYNVHSFGNEQTGYSIKEIAGHLKHNKVDVVCFQEFAANADFTLDSIKKVLREYPYVFAPEFPKGGLRVAMFSKYQMADSAKMQFPHSDNSMQWADLNVNGTKIRVFNNHLQTTNLNQVRGRMGEQDILGLLEGEPGNFGVLAKLMKVNFIKRAQQAKIVRTIIDSTKYPVIVCGDLNDLPTSYVYQTVKGNLSDGFVTNGEGFGYTFRGIHRIFRIDFIFYSKKFKGVSYDSPSLDYSDHNPVFLKLGID